MKKLLLFGALTFVLNSFSQQSFSDYAGSMGGAYLWNDSRKGFLFSGEVNLTQSADRFGTFFGFDLGWSSRDYEYQLSQSEIDQYAIQEMEGTQLMSATIDPEMRSSGFAIGGTLTEMVALNNDIFPFFGIGVNVMRFPKDEYLINHQSKDNSYIYYGSRFVVTEDASWKFGFRASLSLGRFLGINYAFYPNQGNGIQCFGAYYKIIFT